jgi:hypothetical protein
MELTDAVPKVLHQPVAQAHQLAQFLGSNVRQARHGWALLGREAGDAQGIDRVGLGPLQVLSSETTRPQAARRRRPS